MLYKLSNIWDKWRRTRQKRCIKNDLERGSKTSLSSALSMHTLILFVWRGIHNFSTNTFSQTANPKRHACKFIAVPFRVLQVHGYIFYTTRWCSANRNNFNSNKSFSSTDIIFFQKRLYGCISSFSQLQNNLTPALKHNVPM